MSAAIVAHADLGHCNALRLPAGARWLCEVDSRAALAEGLDFARTHSLPTLVLGGGSNVVLRGEYPGLVLRMRLAGIDVLEDSARRTVLRVAAGEAWHPFVMDCHVRGWHGLENLALIPGTVGAAPIQNIGAYGVELARFLREVQLTERESGAEQVLPRDACGFAYRDSVFKHAAAGRFVITAVTLELPRNPPPCTAYAALAAELGGRREPSHADLLAAVIALRTRRLPDPAVLPNVGSFFKNPIVTQAEFELLRARAPQLAHWPQPDACVKLAAAWLVEHAGWNGFRAGSVGVHEQQALVLVNYANATPDDILALAERIMSRVPPDTYRKAVALLTTFDRREQLARISVPTLLIAGGDDKVAPAPVMERMAARIPGAEFVVLEGCGHLGPMDQPGEFNAALLSFLARHRL